MSSTNIDKNGDKLKDKNLIKNEKIKSLNAPINILKRLDKLEDKHSIKN
jgi:hypothetical protein